MPEHYASADIGRLIDLANRVLDRVETMTISARSERRSFAKASGGVIALWITGPAEVPQREEDLVFRSQALEFWRARQDLNPRPPGS